MTYRERREARAARLREWAEKREAKAGAAFDQAHAIGDQIPFGQPILVGHHSERRHRRDLDRIDRSMGKAVEHRHKAESMNSRAANIEDQLEESIYDDDPDAIERLTERIALLEAKRDRIKAFNRSCRKGQPDESLLDEAQRANLASLRRIGWLGKDGAMSGGTTNLSANISRNRERLTRLQRSQEAK